MDAFFDFVDAFSALVDAFLDLMDTFWVAVDAFFVIADAFSAAMDAFFDLVDAFWALVDAFLDLVDTFRVGVDAFFCSSDSFHNTLDSFPSTSDSFLHTSDSFSQLHIHSLQNRIISALRRLPINPTPNKKTARDPYLGRFFHICGIFTVNVVPAPNTLSTSTTPLCISMTSLTIARPRPVPSFLRALSTR